MHEKNRWSWINERYYIEKTHDIINIIIVTWTRPIPEWRMMNSTCLTEISTMNRTKRNETKKIQKLLAVCVLYEHWKGNLYGPKWIFSIEKSLSNVEGYRRMYSIASGSNLCYDVCERLPNFVVVVVVVAVRNSFCFLVVFSYVIFFHRSSCRTKMKKKMLEK